MKFSAAFILLFCIFFGCQNAPNDTAFPGEDTLKATGTNKDTDQVFIAAASTNIERQILDKISALPEYKSTNSYIDSITDHKRGIATMIFKPEKGSAAYSVRAGLNGDQRFETYYTFYVDTITLSVKIADPVNGDIIPIADWRLQEAQNNSSLSN